MSSWTDIRIAAVVMTFAAAANAAKPSFRTVEIDNAVKIGYAVATGHFNADDKPDVILVDKNEIAWYENPTWTKHVILKDAVKGDHVCMAVADINNDGMSEIAIGAHWHPGDTVDSGSVYYLLPPKDRRQPWKPVELPREPTVHRMRWADVDADEVLELVMAPLHGRGNKNFMGEGVRVLSYEVPNDMEKGEWITEIVDDSLHVVHNLEVIRWDNDIAHEILLASFEGVFLCDRSNDGRWSRVQLAGGNQETSPHRGSSEIRTGRLPGGQRFLATVEPWHGNQVVVYTPSDKPDQLWQRHVVAEDLKEAHAVWCADLMNEGADQLIIGWRQKAGKDNTVGVNLYQPLDGSGDKWKIHPIDVNGMACEDLTVADLNDDGRLDIIAAGRATQNLKIYFNEGVR
jgi:hypothetical protein